MIGPRGVLRLASLGFLAFGAWALVNPASMLSLVGVQLNSPAATAEARAYYGGLELGFGVFLWWSARAARAQTAALAACSLYAGCAGGRLVGMVLARTFDPYVVLSGLGELTGAAATAWAYRRL